MREAYAREGAGAAAPAAPAVSERLNSNTAIDPDVLITYILGARTVSLPDGTRVGQPKTVVQINTANSVVEAANVNQPNMDNGNADISSFALTKAGDFANLTWGADNKWHIAGASLAVLGGGITLTEFA